MSGRFHWRVDTVSTLGFGNARFWPFVAACFLALVVFVSREFGAELALRAAGLSRGWSAAAVALAALTVYAVACWRFGDGSASHGTA
jgi:hypothetical protein